MNTTITDKHYSQVIEELDRYRSKDFTFSSGRILGSMCTIPHPIAQVTHMRFLDTNLGDPEVFSGTTGIKSKFIAFICDLLNSPETASGEITSGGTEGNITAMWVAKQISGKREIIVPENAHFSFQKIASLMDMKLNLSKLDEYHTVDIKSVKRNIDKETAAVVGIAGSTELGTVDCIPELSELCQDENVFFHVDAAFGGFVLPFLKELGYDVPNFDFRLQGVSSISIDSHKMGYSTIPLGILVFREKRWKDKISVISHCVSSTKQAGMLGTRPGGAVAAAYAVAQYLGKEGYKELIRGCMETTFYAEEKIREIGLDTVVEPTMNVLGVKLKQPSKVLKMLCEYGWRVNLIERISCIRLVMMPHVTKKIIDEFIPVLERVCRRVGEL
jgi:tyrosine decarboxylase/aspartate 1-decarboxylase